MTRDHNDCRMEIILNLLMKVIIFFKEYFMIGPHQTKTLVALLFPFEAIPGIVLEAIGDVIDVSKAIAVFSMINGIISPAQTDNGKSSTQNCLRVNIQC